MSEHQKPTHAITFTSESSAPGDIIETATAVMQPDLGTIVTEEDLERQLTFLQSAAAGESAGIFGPKSVLWRVNREAAVFLGAGRALALQLAHPWVAAAVDAHSQALSDPIGRFQRTFSIVLTMTFGTTT